MSFDELQELFLLSHDDGTVDDEELLLLHEEFSPKKTQTYRAEIITGWNSKT